MQRNPRYPNKEIKQGPGTQRRVDRERERESERDRERERGEKKKENEGEAINQEKNQIKNINSKNASRHLAPTLLGPHNTTDAVYQQPRSSKTLIGCETGHKDEVRSNKCFYNGLKLI